MQAPRVRGDPAEPGERQRTLVAGRRLGRDLGEQHQRALGIARLEPVGGRLETAAAGGAGEHAGRQPARLLEEVGGLGASGARRN